MPES